MKLSPGADGTRVTAEIRRAPTQARAGRAVADVIAALNQLPPNKPARKYGRGQGERLAISVAVTALLLMSVFAAFAVGTPKKVVAIVPSEAGSTGRDSTEKVNNLPATALEQPWLYQAEIGVTVFLGGLLILTPAFIGITQGRLPIEISTRGVKYGEEAAAADKVIQESVRKIEGRLDLVEPDLARTKVRVDELTEHTGVHLDA